MVTRKLTNSNILSISSLYGSGLSTWEIAKRFNIQHSTILHHMKRLNIERRNKSSAAKEGVKSGRIKIKKHNIPSDLIISEDLSYIFGVLCGDGCISCNKKLRRYHIVLSATDKEFVDKFRNVLRNYFKINPTTEFRKSRNSNWRDQYVTRLCSKEACDFILEFGNFGKDKWKVPEIIKTSDGNIKSSFIMGFFDSEGEIDRKIGRVGAVSMNFGGLKEVQDLLSFLKIRSTIIKKKDLRPNTSQKYVLRIHDKNSILLFYSLVGFTIDRKQKILKEFLVKKGLT
ncbi:MAG: LAGLIDADG family homing endonuclease [Nanoarchaeota archaeon]